VSTEPSSTESSSTESSPPICSYEGSDYQRRFWDEGGRSYEDRAEAVALRRLLPRSGRLMLELGAGAGRNTARYGGYDRVVLVDYSRTQIEQALERLGPDPRYVYVAADVYHLPFVAGAFDGATMIRVLHHMAEPRAALAEVRRVMAPGGVFILEYANKRNIKAILRWLLRRQSWSPFDRTPIEYVPLNFDMHPRAVDEWLADASFTRGRRLTVSHFRLGVLKRRVPTGLLVRLDSWAQLTGDWWQLSPSVFTRCVASGEGPVAAAPTADPAALFACPSCGHHPLVAVGDGLSCAGCGATWAVRDGIYDFRAPIRPDSTPIDADPAPVV
jgi:SAM-dependent methyltransferase